MSAATIAADGVTEGKRGAFHRLYYGQTHFDFVRKRKIWFLISGIVIVAGVISLATQGLNYSIDFVGGTSWEMKAQGVSVTQVRNAVAPYGLSGAAITTLGSGSKAEVEVEAKLGKGGSGAVSSANAYKIAQALGKLTHQSASEVSIESVGPTWGSQVTHKAIEALIVFLVMIAIYISVFFEWKMALAALIAVLHDVVVTVGIYSLLQFEVTPDTIVAFLTILGYSLYDTIVVFDRVRDNTRGLGATGKLRFTDVVNLSMNQTLARSINTSLVAIMPILSVLVLGAYFLGATTLQYFGLALFIGLTSGAYSSLFIASPIVASLKEREPRYAQIRQRLDARGQGLQLLTPAAVAAGVLDDTREKVTSRKKKSGSAKAAPLRPTGGGAPAPAVVQVADSQDVDEIGDGPEYGDEDAVSLTPVGNGSRPAPRQAANKRPAAANQRAGANRNPAQRRKKKRKR
ncbi:MAG: protein translocase subunit SecF [Acidimicrobiales bacterium]